MEHLQQHGVVYLDNATLLLEEFASNYAAWQSRPLQHREELVRALHDADVGEDWDGEDPWSDVSFSPEEIIAFSAHILVDGDDGQPEWSHSPGAVDQQPGNSPNQTNFPLSLNQLSDDPESE